MFIVDGFYSCQGLYNDFYTNNSSNREIQEYQVVSTVDDTAVTVEQFKEHYKLDGDNSESRQYIEMLCQAATLAAEWITRKELIQKQYKTYFSSFNNMVLQKSKVQSVNSIQYLDSEDAFQTVDSDVYYINDTDKYPTIFKKSSKQWPDILTDHAQPIKVLFTTGYSVNTGVPTDLKLAIMQHMGILYEYRGDWNSTTIFQSGYLLDSIPPASLLIYNMYRCKMINL